MKITIDLKDPEIQETLRLAIEARAAEMVAEKFDSIAIGVIHKKLERLNIGHIDTLTKIVISEKIAKEYSTRTSWNNPTKIEQMVLNSVKSALKGA